MSRVRRNTFPMPGSFSTSSTSWCWQAKHSMRCAANFSVREPISKVRGGVCAATFGTSPRSVKSNVKASCRQYTKLGRAMSLRETLQAIYASPDRQSAEAELDWWCGWAARSRLSPFRILAKTVRQHWEGILAYFDTQLTSAAIEAVNGVIQLAKRMARGFRNFVYFRTAAYHRACDLKLAA